MNKPDIFHYDELIGKQVVDIKIHPKNISRNILRRPVITFIFDDGSYLPLIHNDKNTRPIREVEKALIKYADRAKSSMLFLPITDAYVSTLYHEDGSIESIITITVNNDALTSVETYTDFHGETQLKPLHPNFRGCTHKDKRNMRYQRYKEHSLSLFSQVQRHPITKKMTNKKNELVIKNTK